MSTPTFQQASSIPMSVSTDNGVTWKSIVCKKAMNFNGTLPTNVDDTDCGPAVGVGSPSFTFDFEAAANSTPDSTQMSVKALLAIHAASPAQLVLVRIMYPVPGGTDLYIAGEAYLTSFNVEGTTGNVISFNGTFTGNGSVDTTP